MLKLLRRKDISKRIFYVLAAIVIPAFVVWGSSSVLSKEKTPNYAGLMNGKKVSFEDFRKAYFAWKTQLRLQYGDKAEEVANNYLNPVQATWDRLIFLQEANRRGFRASDQEVLAMITSYPFLQRNGQFDRQSYFLFLKYSLGISGHIFEEQLRENLAMGRVFDQETKNISAEDEEVRREYEKLNMATRVRYVAFLHNAYKDSILVTDEDIKNFYDKSREKLQIPPQINVAYVGIESETKMTTEEKKSATERIQKVLTFAKEKGLEAAAKEFDMPLKETGLFGFEDSIPGFGWIPQLSGVLFDMGPDELSKIVETSRSISIFYIKEKKDAYIPDMKDAQPKVKDLILNEKSKEIAQKKAIEFLEKIKVQGMSFDDAVKDSGLTVKETPPFTQESYVEELGMAEPLKTAAFKLEKDNVSDEAIALEQGFYIIQSLETPVFDDEKFKEEKDEFRKQVIGNKRNQAFTKIFEEMRKKARVVSYVNEDNIR
jgi:hypothetical protein